MPLFDPVPSRPAVLALAGGHFLGRPAAPLPEGPTASRCGRDTTPHRPRPGRR